MEDKEITQAGRPLVITYLLYLPSGVWGGPTPLYYNRSLPGQLCNEDF